MRWTPSLLLGAAAAVAALLSSSTHATSSSSSDSDRCFPDGFLFGSATASYQVEGGWNATGRTPSIWDDFCRDQPNMQCANVADDFVHRYKDDIELMADTGLKSFRFSISWSRVMNWNASSKRMQRNQPGIDFYHSVIDELNKHKIVPILTLYHWDLPRELHTELSPPGWLNTAIVDHFLEFAELMYAEYGVKVNFWSTFNEPWSFTTMGYGSGLGAPGLGNSGTNVYTAAHNVLIAHGKAVEKFRALKEVQEIGSDARIGIVLCSHFAYPLDASNAKDVAAVERRTEFMLGWFLQPIVSGEYPAIMRARAGDRLPTFSSEEAALVKGSYDLFMLNHYASHAVTNCDSENSATKCSSLSQGWERDMGIDESHIPEGALRSAKNKAGQYNCAWFSGYPRGYLDNIKWMHKRDPNAEILLTENGFCGNEEIENEDQLWYYQSFLDQVYKAITEEGIKVIGYTAWSFVDNYEWGSFNPRFGLYYVNFTSQTGSKEGYTPKPTDLTRVPRLAARWYANVTRTMCLGERESSVLSVVVHEGQEMVSHHSRTAIIVGTVVLLVLIAFVALRSRRAGSTSSESRPLLGKHEM